MRTDLDLIRQPPVLFDTDASAGDGGIRSRCIENCSAPGYVWDAGRMVVQCVSSAAGRAQAYWNCGVDQGNHAVWGCPDATVCDPDAGQAGVCVPPP